MSYDSTIISDSPTVFWPLNDAISANPFPVADSSGNGHTGSALIAIAATAGQASLLAGDPTASSIALLDVDITVPSIPGPGMGDMAMEVWFETTDVTSQMVLLNYASLVNFQISSGIPIANEGTNLVSGPSSVGDGNPHYAALVRRSGMLSLWIDSASVGTPVASTVDFGSSGVFEAASLGSGSYYFRSGNLQKIAFYNGTLSDAQILAHYNAGIGGGGGDTTPPTLSALTVPSAGSTVTATLSEAGCIPASGSGGFSLSGTAATVASWAISGTTLTITLTGLVQSGETVLLSYDRGVTTDDISDVSSNYLANISSAVVTNDSTQGGSPTPGVLLLTSGSNVLMLNS